jgi:hypothetical protein
MPGTSPLRNRLVGVVGTGGAVIVITILKLGLLGGPAAVGTVMTSQHNDYVQKVNAALTANETAYTRLDKCSGATACDSALAALLTSVNNLEAAATNPPALCACAKWGNDIVQAMHDYQHAIPLMKAGLARNDQATFDQAKIYMDAGDKMMQQANVDRDTPAK